MNTSTVGSVRQDVRKLAEEIWPLPDDRRILFNGDVGSDLTMQAWCDYCESQWDLIVRHGDGAYVATTSLDDINWIIHQLRIHRTRDQILPDLIFKCPKPTTSVSNNEIYDNSINFAARVFSMLKVGVVKHQAVPRGYLNWQDGPLQSCVGKYFQPQPILKTENIRLPKTFTVWGIVEIAGIEVSFTDNLADHLLLVEDDKTLLIFHHVSFLEQQLGNNSEAFFPKALVEETLRSLALLFPQFEFSQLRRRSKHRWLEGLRRKQANVIDPRLALCGTPAMDERQIERFCYWRDRLVILKQAYDDAKPSTFSQWWYDRRNSVQWYTFWVAILVLIISTTLGLVQCVASVMQVYKAFHPS